MARTKTQERELAELGTQARLRANKRAKGAISTADWWPEIEWFENLGHTSAEIAFALGMTQRRVNQIKSWGRTHGESSIYFVAEKAKSREDLEPRFAKMVEFTAKAFREFFNAFSGRELPEHCYEWVDEFCNNTNLILNVPPRHAKTTIFAVWVPIWLLAMDRNHEIILVSKAERFARYQAAEIAYNLEHNTELIKAFGRFAPKDDREAGETPWRPGTGEMMVIGRTRIARSGQLSIRSVGMNGQILGMEATCVIVDDATDPAMARSETQREQQMLWLREQVFSRLMPGCHAVVVGQRVHYLDMYGELASQTFQRDTPHRKRGDLLWTTISHPAVKDWQTEETLWPDLWDFDALMETYERMGAASFETMYQQNPLPADARLVDPSWWSRCEDPERPAYKGIRATGDDAFLPISRVISLDPSPTQFNGLVVADVPYSRDSFQCAVLEAKHWQGGMRSIITELGRCLDHYHPDFLIIEHSTFTNWLHEDPIFQTFSKRTTVIGHNTGKNKGNPELGVESLGGDVEFARINLPCGDETGRQMTRLLEEEANVWPHGKHDDVLMALWFIKWNYKRLVPRGVLPTSFRKSGDPSTWRQVNEKPHFDPVRWYRRQKVG